MKVELSDGQWAELRDPETITNRDRREHQRRTSRAFDRMIKEEHIPVDQADDHPSLMSVYLSEELVKDMIVAWSLDLPLPSDNPAVFEDDRFPWPNLDILSQAARPLAAALQGVDFEPSINPTTGRADPESPTLPS